MKFLTLLLLACVACLTLAAPVEEDDGVMKAGSCADAFAVSAAGLAVGMINDDRQDGYVLALHRLTSVNQMSHRSTGMVFYLTLDVVETDCHVISKKHWKSCEARPASGMPVYGQCKATIYINKPQRVVRLYRYKCMIRPVAASKMLAMCPDCPTHDALDDRHVVNATALSLAKFNRESGLVNRFNLVKITRAVSQGGIMENYMPEYIIQESTCANNDTTTEKCPLMNCEFAHKGFCKGSHAITHSGDEYVSAECTIYEPKSAEDQKKLHLLGGETDHSHADKAAEPHDHGTGHDHAQDHTQAHAHGHAHDHAHDHTKDGHSHGQPHDHAHSHHAKAHDHTGDRPHQHHHYAHADGVHTHDHDHDMALDHDHQHAHLHEHEHHHHHHHQGQAGSTPPSRHHHPEGMVIVLPPMSEVTTLPAFPDQQAASPVAGVVLPFTPDPDIPGESEPVIQPFPSTAAGTDCPGSLTPGTDNELVKEAFAADPMFKATA